MDNPSIGTPAGGNNTSTVSSNPAAGADPSPSNEPAVVDIPDENTLIRVKGIDKPVKYGEHVKGFQSQFTKASQEAARLKRELEARDTKLKQLEAAQKAAQTGQQTDPQAAIYQQLEALPYLSGKDAVQVVKSIGDQLKYRDQILLATLKQLQDTQKIVRQLHGSHSSQAFEAKINKVVTDAGYGPEWNDLAQKLYLAYEGDDLDEQFPTIFGDYMTQVEKLTEARRQAKVNAARKQPFIPGRGGQTGPTKPLEIKADLGARDFADELFKTFGGQTET